MANTKKVGKKGIKHISLKAYKCTYTLDEIKRAYWSAFHKSGETFFDYLHDEKDCEESTFSYFVDFVKELTGLEWDDVHKLLRKYKHENT